MPSQGAVARQVTRGALPPLPKISDLMRMYDVSSKHYLGQNFLFDLKITDRIARSAAVKGCTVIEVGGGLGSLTRSIVSSGCMHVFSVEKDKRCIEGPLQELSDAVPQKITIVEGDALKIDEEDLLRRVLLTRTPWLSDTPPPVRIVGNLPFNISAPLLTKWLHQLAQPQGSQGLFNYGRIPLHLMLQKELTERVTAQPGNRHWGRLSITLQNWFHVSAGVVVPGKCFVPVPKVSGQMVSLVPRAQPLVDINCTMLERFTAVLFGQRRKMLRRSLRHLIPSEADVLELLRVAQVDPENRAEDLGVEELCRLAKAVDDVVVIMPQSSTIVY
eukprot:gnl/Spiro4/11097_TR5884_c0_g1_i1.p1 gnl/Spiro4/11097_TR5884_c0_g1~~gnl/Spiro4/11097_TR5884_c0_g1_i1.p1  ORF type:complete len:330 (-),score=62.10 gnl/Spiro4/11097_TR5884_c0_g1_i1:25-1014(-)